MQIFFTPGRQPTHAEIIRKISFSPQLLLTRRRSWSRAGRVGPRY